MDKKTKIVCTIGPASDSVEMLKNLMNAGMNVCRLNFSHGSHEEHEVRINNIKKAREELGVPVAIMLDTKGPEIRLKNFSTGEVNLKLGDKFTLTTREVDGNQDIVSITYEGLPKDVKIGDRILIDDGLVELEVIEVADGTDIVCMAKNYGVIKDKKGVNVPSVSINLPAMTPRDVSDIQFGIKHGVDFIAASFIRKAEDVLDIRKVLEENNGANVGIIAKIENEEGVENLEEIIQASDGIMVARGDLGVEIRTETMPIVQKKIIRLTNMASKPVITATQMLDSMIRNPRPTRAEVTDVANAILDGTDAIMLSGETAAGKYPLEAVHTMHDIALTTEESKEFLDSVNARKDWVINTTTNSISRSSCYIAEQLGAAAILTATATGGTPKHIAKFRPHAPIIAATYTEEVMRSLSLVWGVFPVLSKKTELTDEVIESSIHSALNAGYVKEGNLIVITAGIPVAVGGTTNLIKVHTVGDIVAKGLGIGKRSVSGSVCIGSTREEIQSKFEDGMILVARSTDKDLVEYIERCKAIVVEEGGLTSHAAIVALHFGKPAIVGVKDATNVLEDGETITVDPIAGLIYRGEARVL
ncbi:pyruvate kinase [Microaceticoccus formicicus]|uniref:pyruvate kinase n=1 Tax=Microaceticoccus formicicus TaxID=3118105 RepID=UPI003CD02F37|nr:pyruvate kinase [Peptoniphilaceae bacterium AMB_02]